MINLIIEKSDRLRSLEENIEKWLTRVKNHSKSGRKQRYLTSESKSVFSASKGIHNHEVLKTRSDKKFGNFVTSLYI